MGHGQHPTALLGLPPLNWDIVVAGLLLGEGTWAPTPLLPGEASGKKSCISLESKA